MSVQPVSIPPTTPAVKTSASSPVCALLTWKDPLATGKVFGAILAALVLSKVNFVSFAFHVLYIVLLASAAAEYSGKLLTGEGFVTKYLGTTPQLHSQTFRKSVLPALGDAAGAAEAHIYKVVFAQDIEATLKAAGVAYITFKLTSWFSLYALVFVLVLLAFSVPPLYQANKKEIDAAVAQYSKLAKAKVSEILNLAHKKVAPHIETISKKSGPVGAFIQSKFPTRTAGLTVGVSKPATSAPAAHAAPAAAPSTTVHVAVPEPSTGVSSGSQFPLVPHSAPVGASEVDELIHKATEDVKASVHEPTL